MQERTECSVCGKEMFGLSEMITVNLAEGFTGSYNWCNNESDIYSSRPGEDEEERHNGRNGFRDDRNPDKVVKGYKDRKIAQIW